jgi:hypothetical protein
VAHQMFLFYLLINRRAHMNDTINTMYLINSIQIQQLPSHFILAASLFIAADVGIEEDMNHME